MNTSWPRRGGRRRAHDVHGQMAELTRSLHSHHSGPSLEKTNSGTSSLGSVGSFPYTELVGRTKELSAPSLASHKANPITELKSMEVELRQPMKDELPSSPQAEHRRCTGSLLSIHMAELRISPLSHSFMAEHRPVGLSMKAEQQAVELRMETLHGRCRAHASTNRSHLSPSPSIGRRRIPSTRRRCMGAKITFSMHGPGTGHRSVYARILNFSAWDNV
ncbi:hypothetical protein Dimus_024282 [Dionaea muscipula]